MEAIFKLSISINDYTAQYKTHTHLMTSFPHSAVACHSPNIWGWW